jgi:hypothetical protein
MRGVFAKFGGATSRDMYGPIGLGKWLTGLAKFSAGTGLASGVFCGVGAVGAACWPQQAMVRVANTTPVVANRIVEVIRANGIYSSPVVKTTSFIALLRKKVLARCSSFYSFQKKEFCSGIGTQRSGGRFLKAGMKTPSGIARPRLADVGIPGPSFAGSRLAQSQDSAETV